MKKNQKEKVLKFKSFLKITFLSLLALILIAVFYMWIYFQKPASGEIKNVSTAPTVTTEKIDNASERFEGDYFSFAHDSKYLLKNNQKDFEKNGVLLETAFFAQSDVNSKKIAITVEDIKGRTMADTGNFLMRKKNPKTYKEEKFETEGVKGIAFSRTTESGFLEKVFFISRAEYVAEIAFTGPIVEDESYNLEMTEVLKSIQWKK